VLIVAPDVSLADVASRSETDPEWTGSEELGEVVNGGWTIPPGRSYEWASDLTSGTYYFVCLYASAVDLYDRSGRVEPDTFFFGGGFTVEP
jgi:hypothetical protein